jgi:hypothetical protein
MTVATELRSRPARAQAPVKARELMEKLNSDANKLNIWVRTELNTPAQRPWFTDTGGTTGAGQLAAGGRVAANQLKALPALCAGKTTVPFSIGSTTSPAAPTFRRSNLPTARAFC